MRAHDTLGALIFLATVASVLPGPLRAQDPCIVNQYRLCLGECPEGTTDQGECTTRLNTSTDERWCCCPDSYSPLEYSDSTTPGAPGDSDRMCTAVEVQDADAPVPTDETKDPPPPPWAISAAVNMTARPRLTDDTLSQIRIKVIEQNARTARYVPLVYRLADEVEKIYAENPALVEQTARLIDNNLPILIRLAGGGSVSVRRETVQQLDTLMERVANAPAASNELRISLRSARQDLNDAELLRELGVTIQP